MKSVANKVTEQKLLKKTDDAGRTAFFYGFIPVEAPHVTRTDIDNVKDLVPEWHPAEKAAILREYSEMKGTYLSQPTMLFHEKAFGTASERKNINKVNCELTILGSQKSVCECLLIQTAKDILENAGWKDIIIKINSVGSKECVAEFERRMLGFVRKRMGDFPPDLRQQLKKDLYYLIRCKDEKYKEWTESAPQSVDYLTEQSRTHLAEVLEFMETVGIPYMMDYSLIGDLEYSCEIIFEIKNQNMSDGHLAKGMRWSRLSRKVDSKREVPAASVRISAEALKLQKISPLKKVLPKFYLIQFGPEAKHKSFIVLENLRKAGIPVVHSLAKDKLLGQMSSVEQSGIPYMILMGQKEAIDNVVVVRNTTTRAQFTVSVGQIGEFLKKSAEFN